MVKGFKLPVFNYHYGGMFPGQRVPIIDDFFRLTFVENPGMAFGYYPGVDFKFFLSLFSLLATIGLFFYLYYHRKQALSLRIALAFILGGAAGNLIDRMFYGIFYGYAPLFHGKVVDFLDFDFFDITILGRSYDRFPIFNIADSAVTIGVLVLILFYQSHVRDKNGESEDISLISGDGNATADIDVKTDEDASQDLNDRFPEEKKKETDGESDPGKEISA